MGLENGSNDSHHASRSWSLSGMARICRPQKQDPCVGCQRPTLTRSCREPSVDSARQPAPMSSIAALDADDPAFGHGTDVHVSGALRDMWLGHGPHYGNVSAGIIGSDIVRAAQERRYSSQRGHADGDDNTSRRSYRQETAALAPEHMPATVPAEHPALEPRNELVGRLWPRRSQQPLDVGVGGVIVQHTSPYA